MLASGVLRRSGLPSKMIKRESSWSCCRTWARHLTWSCCSFLELSNRLRNSELQELARSVGLTLTGRETKGLLMFMICEKIEVPATPEASEADDLGDIMALTGQRVRKRRDSDNAGPREPGSPRPAAPSPVAGSGSRQQEDGGQDGSLRTAVGQLTRVVQKLQLAQQALLERARRPRARATRDGAFAVHGTLALVCGAGVSRRRRARRCLDAKKRAPQRTARHPETKKKEGKTPLAP